MMRLTAVVAMVVALSGCYSSQSPQVSVTCRAGKDCEIAWGKAWRWVESVSSRPIKKVDDFRITTTTPKDGEAAIAYEVTKRAVSANTYEISLVAWCANALGCVEDPDLKARNFVQYMTQ
ncbi:MAG TPA: hypothetical protein VK558_17145 [Patescibacteria group bacterium]|nr:hypothetical protein [Patescibacteria group bacterium]